jgi:hypothetical protein
VYFLPAGVSPMLFGLGRGLRLLVPQRLWEKLDDDERASLLLHELAHLRRRDHWVRGFELVVTIAYWWNPLAWWARRELRAAEELCCDAWVTWSMPAAADAYARALVEAVDFMCVSRSRPVLPAMASGIGAFRHLKRRLVMIQQRQGSRGLGWAGAAGVAVAATVLPLSLTRAQDEKPARQPQSASPTTRPQDRDKEKATTNASDSENSPEYRAMRAQLDRNLPECNFDGVGVADVIDFLRDVSGANIFVNWKALADAGVDKNAVVTLRIRNIRLGDALDLVLTSAAGKRHKLGYDVKGGAINISTTADLGGSALVVNRTYGVQDLVGGKDDRRGDELVKMITGSIDASSWAENGGTTGTVKIDDGKLIVAQTPENQEAVKNLIKHARELMKR